MVLVLWPSVLKWVKCPHKDPALLQTPPSIFAHHCPQESIRCDNQNLPLGTLQPTEQYHSIKTPQGVCFSLCECAFMDNTHTRIYLLVFTRMVTRICLSKHSRLSGSELGLMGAISPGSLAGQNGPHCDLCAERDSGL